MPRLDRATTDSRCFARMEAIIQTSRANLATMRFGQTNDVEETIDKACFEVQQQENHRNHDRRGNAGRVKQGAKQLFEPQLVLSKVATNTAPIVCNVVTIKAYQNTFAKVVRN